MFNRRSFLKSSALVALAPTVPGFLTQTAHAAKASRHEPILVVVELQGGNDGLNTVVPFDDDMYQKGRKTLRLPKRGLHVIGDGVGLHPSMQPMAKLFEEQRLSIVQGVGYPRSNRSHDVALATWHTARVDRAEHRGFGWIGRAMDDLGRPRNNAPGGMLVGSQEMPRALSSRKSAATAMASLNDIMLGQPTRAEMEMMSQPGGSDLSSFVRQTALDAYQTSELLGNIAKRNHSGTGSYPPTRLGSQLQLVSQLIQADLGTRVYYTIQPGYDTHQSQLSTHAELLADFSEGLRGFLDDLKQHQLEDRVLVLCFSEFGRQVKENGSAGTDHGTSGPVFLAGSRVAGGLLGEQPDLTNLVDDAPVECALDFRRVYNTILSQWLGLKTDKAFEELFQSLPLLR